MLHRPLLRLIGARPSHFTTLLRGLTANGGLRNAAPIAPIPLIMPTPIQPAKLPPTISNQQFIKAPTLTSLINQYVTPDVSTLDKLLECPEAENSVKEIRADYLRPRDKGPKHLIRIRRAKMKKHKRTKWRKRFAAYVKKIRLRREIKKEKVFRAELLAQIRDAEAFDAEKHVKGILDTIRNRPRPETLEETRERVYTLKLKHRTDVDLVPPKFEDPVPPFKKKK